MDEKVTQLVKELCAHTLDRDGCCSGAQADEKALTIEKLLAAAPPDPACTICGHARDTHSIEPPYECNDDCDCKGFSYVPQAAPASKRELRELVANAPVLTQGVSKFAWEYKKWLAELERLLARTVQEQPPPKRKLSLMLDELVHLAIAIEGQYEKEPEAPKLTAEQVRSVLSQHWLAGIHCHHAISPDDSTYDWATCACSEVHLPHKGTVGEAVGTWIEHVLTALANGGTKGGESQ